MKSGFIKGIMAGAVAGSLTMLVFDPVTPRMRRRAKRKITSAAHDFGDMVESMMPH